MILSTKYIQDESTTALILYVFFSLALFFLIIKWIIKNMKEAEKNDEYYIIFFTDYRLFGCLIILLIGLIAMSIELAKRIWQTND